MPATQFAVREILGFTLVAVLTLGLGNGANTSVFTVLNGILLKMLPVKDPQQLAVVGDPTRASSRSNGTPRTDVFSYPLYKEIRIIILCLTVYLLGRRTITSR